MKKEDTTNTKYKGDGRYMSYRRRNRELSFAMEESFSYRFGTFRA